MTPGIGGSEQHRDRRAARPDDLWGAGTRQAGTLEQSLPRQALAGGTVSGDGTDGTCAKAHEKAHKHKHASTSTRQHKHNEHRHTGTSTRAQAHEHEHMSTST